MHHAGSVKPPTPSERPPGSVRTPHHHYQPVASSSGISGRYNAHRAPRRPAGRRLVPAVRGYARQVDCLTRPNEHPPFRTPLTDSSGRLGIPSVQGELPKRLLTLQTASPTKSAISP